MLISQPVDIGSEKHWNGKGGVRRGAVRASARGHANSGDTPRKKGTVKVSKTCYILVYIASWAHEGNPDQALWKAQRN